MLPEFQPSRLAVASKWLGLLAVAATLLFDVAILELPIFVPVLTSVAAIGLAAIAWLHWIARGKVSRLRPALIGGGLGLLSLGVLIPLGTRIHEAVGRAHANGALKQIALAAHNHQSAYGKLPYAILDHDGKPLLSWRVALLPFIEQESLYKEFHLDEPWDSPHNRTLLPRMPYTYRSFGKQPPEPYMTFLRGFSGPGTAFERPGLRIPDDFPDGTSNTIFLVEAGEAVPWTKPEEIDYHPDRPLALLGGSFRKTSWFDSLIGKRDGFNAAFMDGAVRWIDRDIPEATLRALITRNGGEKVEWPAD